MKRTTYLFALLLVISHGLVANNALAANKYALVIGNSDYTNDPLDNPRNDAIDMAEQLEKLGYIIHGGGPRLNLNRRALEQSVNSFSKSLPREAQALVYYAGHGVATSTDNYLIPIDHELNFQDQLPDRSTSLRSIVNLLKNSNTDGINVVLLDACRDNPLEKRFRSARKGLKRLKDIPRGIFIGYAADDGQVAQDGTGRNGVYTAQLLDIMRGNPNTIIELAHKEVARRVIDQTGGKQFPVSENKIYGDWGFGDCGEAADKQLANQGGQGPTDPSTEAAPSSKRKTWMIVGGVLAAVALGALAAGGSSEPSAEPNYTLILNPPEPDSN